MPKASPPTQPGKTGDEDGDGKNGGAPKSVPGALPIAGVSSGSMILDGRTETINAEPKESDLQSCSLTGYMGVGHKERLLKIATGGAKDPNRVAVQVDVGSQYDELRAYILEISHYHYSGGGFNSDGTKLVKRYYDNASGTAWVASRGTSPIANHMDCRVEISPQEVLFGYATGTFPTRGARITVDCVSYDAQPLRKIKFTTDCTVYATELNF